METLPLFLGDPAECGRHDQHTEALKGPEPQYPTGRASASLMSQPVSGLKGKAVFAALRLVSSVGSGVFELAVC